MTLNLQVDNDEVGETTQPTANPPSHANGIHQIMNVTDYSNLTKLFHISAYVLHVIMNSKQPDTSQRKIGPLLPEELTKVSQAWICNWQQTVFADEFTNLQSRNSKVKHLPLVRQLHFFLDNNNIIRCGGRIQNAPLSTNTKFPSQLPKDHPLTKLIVYAAHNKQLHAGVNSTVAAEYWIPSARQLVRRLFRKCVICHKVMGKPYSIPEPKEIPLKSWG